MLTKKKKKNVKYQRLLDRSLLCGCIVIDNSEGPLVELKTISKSRSAFISCARVNPTALELDHYNTLLYVLEYAKTCGAWSEPKGLLAEDRHSASPVSPFPSPPVTTKSCPVLFKEDYTSVFIYTAVRRSVCTGGPSTANKRSLPAQPFTNDDDDGERD